MSAMKEILHQIDTGEIDRYVCEECGQRPSSLDWKRWAWNGHYWIHKHPYGHKEVYLGGPPS